MKHNAETWSLPAHDQYLSIFHKQILNATRVSASTTIVAVRSRRPLISVLKLAPHISYKTIPTRLKIYPWTLTAPPIEKGSDCLPNLCLQLDIMPYLLSVIDLKSVEVKGKNLISWRHLGLKRKWLWAVESIIPMSEYHFSTGYAFNFGSHDTIWYSRLLG